MYIGRELTEIGRLVMVQLHVCPSIDTRTSTFPTS